MGNAAVVHRISGRLTGLQHISGTLTREGLIEGRLTVPRAGWVDIPDYEGPYVVKPSFEEQVLETKDKHMLDDVTVNPIEISRTTNLSGGITVYIGGLVDA